MVLLTTSQSCLLMSRLPHHWFCTMCKTDIDISHQEATGNKHSPTHTNAPWPPKYIDIKNRKDDKKKRS